MLLAVLPWPLDFLLPLLLLLLLLLMRKALPRQQEAHMVCVTPQASNIVRTRCAR